MEDEKVVAIGGHLIHGTITTIKCLVSVGVMEGNKIKANLGPVLNQVNIVLPT